MYSTKIKIMDSKPTPWKIEDLTEGKCQIICTPANREIVSNILKIAFPEDVELKKTSVCTKLTKYIYRSFKSNQIWRLSGEPVSDMPIIDCEDLETELNYKKYIMEPTPTNDSNNQMYVTNTQNNPSGVQIDTNSNREFSTGSKRDNDSDKPLVNHLTPYARLRFGYRLRAGANKYGAKNWHLGQPTETQIESINRHLAKFEYNIEKGIPQDEDHLSAIIFNVMMIMQNEDRDGVPVDAFKDILS